MTTSPRRPWIGRALGVPVRLHIDDPVVGELMRDLLADLAEDPRQSAPPALAPEVRVDVVGQGPWHVRSPEHRATAPTLPAAVSHILTALNLSAVATTPHLAMHTAVVVRGDRALVVPGPSGHGKTTITAALLGCGWDYVSDEALCLRWADSTLVSYPRPLALSPWAREVFGVDGVPASDEVIVKPQWLGARVATSEALRGVRVRHVVTLVRRHDADPTLTGLHRADALAALLRRGFTHHRDVAAALAVVQSVVKGAQCWQLTLSDPREAANFMTAKWG